MTAATTTPQDTTADDLDRDLDPDFESVEDARVRLRDVGYLTDDRLATTAYLQSALGKPLLLEGPAGVGKTQLAQSVAAATGRRLLRLQCYEGQDETKALYEWDYGKQLLYTQILREKIGQIVEDAPDLNSAVNRIADQDSVFFSERFLAPRPLLEAVQSEDPVVLLVDEVDRADEALEAVLLELLAEFQVSVPEVGTFVAKTTPLVILTSNNTRDLSAALKRRCLHLFLDYPTAERELDIIAAKETGLGDAIAEQLVTIVRRLRDLDLRKSPSISETIDWARTLTVLGVNEITPSVLADTLNVVMKYERDIAVATREIPRLLDPNAEVPESLHSHGHGHGHSHSHGHHDHDHSHDDKLPANDGAEARRAKDEPGRHDEAYYGTKGSGASGIRKTVSASQGARSFSRNSARKRPV